MDFRDYDTRLAAYAVVADEHNRILLALWNDDSPEPRWTLPGGGVELEETVEEAAVREVREETGYDVRLGRLLAVDSYVRAPEDRLQRSDRPLRAVRVLFEARILCGDLTREVGGTTHEARWIPISDVPTLPRVSLVDVALRFHTAR